MEDSEKIKPYIAHLNKQLRLLKPELEKLTAKPLDEQLLMLNDERARLALTNKYAYVLSSLMFAYMKLLNVKDNTPIMAELSRVKAYMNKAKLIDEKSEQASKSQQEEQERAKRVINNALDGRQTGPAISKVNFQGKHTRFEPPSSTNIENEIDAKEISERIKDSKQKKGQYISNKKTKSTPQKVSKKNK